MKFIKWLLSLFRRHSDDTQTTTPPIESNPSKESNSSTSDIKKVAIIVGHGNGDGGAESKDGKRNEFEYNSIVAEHIEKSQLHGKNSKVFYRGKTGILGVALEAVTWMPDLSIELHLNSFNGIAKGCEVLVLKGDNESAEIGKSFTKSFCSKFNRVARRDEGINWINGSDRGGASLKAVSPIKRSVLVEPFFIDNDSEYIAPSVYAEWLCTWLKGI